MKKLIFKKILILLLSNMPPIRMLTPKILSKQEIFDWKGSEIIKIIKI